MTNTSTFRVHFADGRKHDVLAANPDEARQLANLRHGSGVVTKIKRVK